MTHRVQLYRKGRSVTSRDFATAQQADNYAKAVNFAANDFTATVSAIARKRS